MPEISRFFGIVIAMYYDEAELLEAWGQRAAGQRPPKIDPLR